MTTPLEPIRPRIEPAERARRIERTGRDAERKGGQQGRRQEPQQDDGRDEEPDGIHVDVRA